jgi:predicted membrane chloride channel (bestrophin family)
MIIYESSGYRLLLHWYGSVLFTSLQAALVAAVINVGLALWFRHNPYPHEFRDVFPSAAVYTPVSLGIAFVLVFRCSQAYARFTEATSHCFQMRSQLGNACMQLHSTTKRTDDWEEFHRRHRRLSYAFQRAAMQELRGEHDLQKLRKLTTLLPEEAEALSRCPNRPLRIMHWMSLSVSERWDEGGFRCPPPVLARTYLHLTDAMNAYNAAWKIARTPFPFPYAQLSLAFLVVMQLTVPVVMLVFIEDM